MRRDPKVQAESELAAAVIRERGWIQGRVRDDQGRVCLLGGLSVAGASSATFKAVEVAIGGGRSIASWNDDPDRTVADVLSLLEFVGTGRLR